MSWELVRQLENSKGERTVAISDETNQQLHAGDVFDNRFITVYCLGRGGYAAVYQARDGSAQTEVALKILHPEKEDGAGDGPAARMRAEAEISKRLKHPAIRQVYEARRSAGGRTYLIMEYIDGQALHLEMCMHAKGRLLPLQAVRIAIAVCGALEAAHASGVIHRDIAPENIMVSGADNARPQVRLIDFGIALSRETACLDEPGIVYGKLRYMSPEQACDGNLTPATDLYALGVTLYEILTGAVPFRPTLSAEDFDLEERKAGPPPLISRNVSAPPLLEAILRWTLAYDRAARPQTAAALRYHLRRVEELFISNGA